PSPTTPAPTTPSPTPAPTPAPTPEPNPCDAVPCKNGGTCNAMSSQASGYVCTCPPGFDSRNDCQLTIQPEKVEEIPIQQRLVSFDIIFQWKDSARAVVSTEQCLDLKAIFNSNLNKVLARDCLNCTAPYAWIGSSYADAWTADE